MTTEALDASARTTSRAEPPYPTLNFKRLDTLWLQVTGTVCNLACLHCFISCGPKNRSHDYMTLAQVRDSLAWAKRYGVKEYYFTGGEPFLHPDIRAMIEETLAQGPLTILTNGILVDDELAAWLAGVFARSRYSFDLRVSLDGTTAEENDVIRGRGTFDKILASVDRLVAAGLNPVITVTEAFDDAKTRAGRTRFLEFLRQAGLTQPRLKIMPLLRMGAEEGRARGYHPWETLAGHTLTEEDLALLQCTSCRMVGAKGVYVCPILIDEPQGRMGQTLQETLRPYRLSHAACYTCKVEGLSCAT